MLNEVVSPAVWLPTCIEEAWKMKEQLGADACLIAAGTLLQTEWEKGKPRPYHLISLERIDEMRGLVSDVKDGQSILRIGALTTLGEILSDPLIVRHSELIAEAMRSIAAPAVRNRATIGGNVAGGIGDAIPVLLVMDTLISIFDGTVRRNMPLWQWIQENRKSQASSPDIVVGMELLRQGAGDCFYKKIGRRETFIPSIVTVAGSCTRGKDGKITHIRLAAGGGETPPQRFEHAENLLQGTVVDEAVLERVHMSILNEFQVVSDAFASASYRKQIAANLIASELAALAQ